MSSRIGIVDDHPVFRIGLRTALGRSGLDVAWECATAAEAYQRLQSQPVDAVILDRHLGEGPDGIAASLRIRQAWPQVRVVLISGLALEDAIEEGRRAGAAAVVGKELPIPELVSQLRRVLGDWLGGLPGELQMGSALSQREAQILRHIRAGRTNREIAHRLGVSTATVNKQVQSLLRKLGARNRAQAATMAVGDQAED